MARGTAQEGEAEDVDVLAFLDGVFGGGCRCCGGGCGVEGEGDYIVPGLRVGVTICKVEGLREFGGGMLGFLVYTTAVLAMIVDTRAILRV